MNFMHMNSPRYLALLLMLFVCLPSLKAQINSNFSTHQLVEQEKSRYSLMARGNATGLSETMASANFDVNHYRCEWSIDPAIKYIQGKITSSFTITSATNTISFDLADNLTVDSILYHNAIIPYTRPGSFVLNINFPSTLNIGTKDSLTIFYQGVPPNSGFSSFTASSHAGVPVLWTLSEPYGARDWWPCKNGLDDKTDSIDVIITTPDAYFAASNGMLANEFTTSGKRTVYWKHRYPIASYLVAFAATNYVVQNDTIQLKDKVLPLNQYVYPENAAVFDNSKQYTRRTMRLYEGAFGPYPFRNERYAHTQCGFGGGMEHQTNSFMGNASESLITHELGHQWFGDRVTCSSWKDIWLNEGFATFMANYAMESFYPPSSYMPIYQAQLNSIVAQPGGSVLVDDTTNVGRIFSYRLSYAKGAWLLKMLRFKLGDSAFYRGLRSYLTDPLTSYEFAQTDDLKRNLEASSGQDLDGFFLDWYNGQGHPSYKLDVKLLGGTYFNISLSQTTSHPSVSFFEMPVPILFKGSTKDTTIIINHTGNGQQQIVNLGFVPLSATIDPNLQLISANNKVNISTDNSSGPNTIVIYPNPVRDQFAVQLLNFTSSDVDLQLYTSDGKLLWKQSKKLQNGSDYITVDSHQLPRGIYLLSIRSKDTRYVKKIMK